MPTPTRDLNQRMSALAKGNKIRTGRAELKRDIKADVSLADGIRLLTNPPALVHTMKVFDLLRSLNGVGKIKADAHLRHACVSPSKTIAGLSDRQRAALVTRLLDVQVSRGYDRARHARYAA
jgi:hypothetical protein